MTKAKLPEYTEMAADINTRWVKLDLTVEGAKAACLDSVEQAWQLGGVLNTAKELIGHGKWEAWFRLNIRGKSSRTARDYMALANRRTIADLVDTKNIMQAFRKAGLYQPPAPKLLAAPAESESPKEAALAKIGAAFGDLMMLTGKPDRTDVESVNLTREIGLHLQAWAGGRQMTVQSFKGIASTLPPGLDFKKARLCIRVAKGMPAQAMTVAETQPFAKAVRQVRGSLVPPALEGRGNGKAMKNAAVIIFGALANARNRVEDQIERAAGWSEETKSMVLIELLRLEIWGQRMLARIREAHE